MAAKTWCFLGFMFGLFLVVFAVGSSILDFQVDRLTIDNLVGVVPKAEHWIRLLFLNICWTFKLLAFWRSVTFRINFDTIFQRISRCTDLRSFQTSVNGVDSSRNA